MHPPAMNPTPEPRRSATRISAADFAYVQQLMRKRTGIALEAGKAYLAETRLSALALQEGYETLGALLDSLHTERESGDLHRQVVEALAITGTSFFPDPHPLQ